MSCFRKFKKQNKLHIHFLFFSLFTVFLKLKKVRCDFGLAIPQFEKEKKFGLV